MLSEYKSLYLAKGRDISIHRKHPWVFSGGVKQEDEGIKNGDVIWIRSITGEIQATGHYQKGSIICRILAFDQIEVDQNFYIKTFTNALKYRAESLGIPNSETNAFRLIHGEGDGMPGLIIDIYDDTAVIQAHSVGMAKDIKIIIEALQNVFLHKLKTIYNRSKESVHFAKDGLLWGEEKEETIVKENGHSFIVNWAEGQKTGFFLDQRDNRKFVEELAKSKNVLNLFSYTGGFSIYAIKGGAASVDSIDISSKAIALLEKNASLINPTPNHTAITENVMDFISNHEGELPYELIIVDPPAFAKSMKKRHNAIQAYKRLNAAVFKKAKSGTIVLTFSCSQVVDVPLFKGAIVSAGIEAGRPVRIMKQLSQGADHPINLFHPEGHYLKGFMLYVE